MTSLAPVGTPPPKVPVDRSLEKGRIVQCSPDGPFELWLSVHGTQTRLAEFTTEEDAQVWILCRLCHDLQETFAI